MTKTKKYLVIFLLAIIAFIFTYMKTPDELSLTLYKVASETKLISVIMHGIFLALFMTGLVFKKTRDLLFSVLLLILSGTAMIISLIYMLPPNIIIFATFFILTVSAVIKKEISFDLSDIGVLGKIVGFTSLAAGFYYLHWVEAPIWTNALLYSPLGIINCPTLVAFCGLLIFLKKPGLALLELFAGIITLYFGFFGIMRLGAYIDVVLILSGAYLIIRQVCKLVDNEKYELLL